MSLFVRMCNCIMKYVNYLKVNELGTISFLGPVQFPPDPFPLRDGRRMIAVFWCFDPNDIYGNVSYREVLRITSNNNMFENADIIIRNTFISMKGFQSSWMFITTWGRNTILRSSSEL